MGLLWFVIALFGAALVWLIASDGGGTFGLRGDDFAQFIALAGWVILIAPAILLSGRKLGDTFRQLSVWALIILALVAGYQYRFQLQDFASTVTGGLMPASPISVDGEAVMVWKSASGHFETDAVANGAKLRFLVDTGATTTVLTETDAEAAGIDTGSLDYIIPVQTANGEARAAKARLDTLSIGPISRNNVPVMVAPDSQLTQSLLGMSFLSTLSGLDIRRDRLILHD